MYMLGSIVCALAPNMFVLILGRVLHGLGGGGLTSTGMVVLGDIAAPRDRGKYYGYFSMTYTTAGACGPALGGFLAEYLHCSVIFWMNIPLGILALVLTLTLLKRLPRHEQPHRLDFLGAFLIMTASVAFMLALSMGGVRYPWTSLPILALCALALIVGAGFVWRLLTAPEPLIPLAFFSNPVTTLAIVANAFGWGAIVGLHIFLPIYLQNVIGMSPLMAGLSVMMLAITLNVSAGVTGTILPRLTHYKVIPIIGLLISIAAVMVLAWHAHGLSWIEFQILLALIGIGFGGLPPLSSTVLQNSVPIHTFGTAVATMQFSRNLYCTMMVAVFGAIVLTGTADGGAAAATGYSAEGFVRIFYAAAASFALALIAVVLVEAKPLQTTHV
jgi:MFS family permease